MLKIATALLFLLFILLVIVIADTGSMPSSVRDFYNFPGGDRVGHLVLYGILAFLLARAFPRPVRVGPVAIPVVILVLLAFAAIEEYSQKFFSSRTADVVDLVCSFIGILAGTWLAVRKN